MTIDGRSYYPGPPPPPLLLLVGPDGRRGPPVEDLGEDFELRVNRIPLILSVLKLKTPLSFVTWDRFYDSGLTDFYCVCVYYKCRLVSTSVIRPPSVPFGPDRPQWWWGTDPFTVDPDESSSKRPLGRGPTHCRVKSRGCSLEPYKKEWSLLERG